MNDMAKAVAYSAAAAGFTQAARSSARAVGWPPAIVGVIGALFLALAGTSVGARVMVRW